MNRSLCGTGREGAVGLLPGRAWHSAVPVALAIALGALCVASPAWGALYKWTDENGHVVYSDQPPPGNIKVDTIAGPLPPSNPNAAKELAGREAESRKQQVDAAESAKKLGQQRADAEKRAGVCKDARAELTRLSADQIILYKVNEKGETVYLDDSERRRRRETLETYIKSSCRQG